MKKNENFFLLPIILFGAVILISSCRVDRRTDSQVYVESYETYVDSVIYQDRTYSDEEWTELEREYGNRRAEVDENIRTYDESTVRRLEIADERWNEFRENRNRMQHGEHMEMHDMHQMRIQMGIPGGNFDSINAANIRDVYEKFVTHVEQRQEMQSEMHWSMVDSMWNRLNIRYQEVRQQIPAADNTRITELRTRYTAIKSAVQPDADDPSQRGTAGKSGTSGTAGTGGHAGMAGEAGAGGGAGMSGTAGSSGMAGQAGRY
jgi:hypothetical protein